MIRITAVCALLVIVSCATSGLPDNPALRDYALPQKDFRLKSGLRVVVQEDHTAPLVVVTSVYSVGSTSDPKGLEGLAHVVEHMAFKGRPGGGPMLWDRLKRTGAAFNATTEPDYTSYFEIAPKEKLHELLEVHRWRLMHTLEGVTDEMYNTEREVVRNELRLGHETFGGPAFDDLLALAFPSGHPLSRSVIGSHQSLSASTLEHARQFVKQHYRPNNCVIVIAGDVNPDVVRDVLNQWPDELKFGPGGLQGPAVPPRKLTIDTPMPEPPPPVSTALKRIKGPVAMPQLIIAWSAPGASRGNDMLMQFAASAMNVALAGGVEFKFKDELQGMGAGVQPMVNGSLLIVFAEMKSGADPEKIRKRLLDAVLYPLESDMQRALVSIGKWGVATSLLLASGDPIGSALSASKYLAATGRTAYYSSNLEELARLQSTDVAEFLSKYLRRERAVAVYLEPENEKIALPAAGPTGPAPAHVLDRGAEMSLAGMGPDEIRKVARVPGLAKLPRFKLPNGLEVVVVSRTGSPVAEIRLELAGGDGTVTPYGMAEIATSFSHTTCRNHGSLRPVGGAIGWSTGLLSSSFSVEVLAGNLVNGMAVLSDQVSCREVLEEGFLSLDELMDLREARLKEVQQRPHYKASTEFLSLLYPEHVYGLLDPDPAALRKVTPEQAESFLRTHFRPDGAIVVVVGDVQEAEVRAMAQTYFGGWTGGGAGGRAVPPDPGPGPQTRTIRLLDRAAATQTTISLGCRTAPVTPESLPAFHILEGVIGEGAWRLREQQGATYGLQAVIGMHPGNHTELTIDGAVSTAHTGAALKALLDDLAAIGTEGPDVKRFTLKRWDAALEFNRDFARANSLAGAVLRAARMGWPVSTFDQYPENLAATSRSAVRDILKPCLGKEVVVMVGKAAEVKPQLEVVGLKLTE